MKLTVTPAKMGYQAFDEYGNDLDIESLYIGPNGQVQATVLVHEIEIFGAEVSEWMGLENVPRTALLQELERREKGS